jgi:hypothetical protein
MKSIFRRNRYTRRTKTKAAISLDSDRLALEQDPARRLRNAEIALHELDPHFESWIKKNTRKSWSILKRVRIIEKQARTLLMERYTSVLGPARIKEIINSNLAFNDQGHLWAR